MCVGVADPAASSIGGDFIMRDSTIRLLAGGRGAGLSTFEQQIYDDVDIHVEGGSGANIGLQNAGSGFDPQIIDSRVVVQGSGSVGIKTNTGNVKVRSARPETCVLEADRSEECPTGNARGTREPPRRSRRRGGA